MNVLRIRSELRNGKSIFDLPLRVTFYARVSTDKDEQLNSLENQHHQHLWAVLDREHSSFCFNPSYCA